mgnify:CR=1 FL=1
MEQEYYLLVDVDIHNIDEYKKYLNKVKPMVEKFGGKYLIKGGKIDAKETDLWKPTRIVLVQFPNTTSALNWYNSEEYRPLKNLRLTNATSTILFIEGVDSKSFKNEEIKNIKMKPLKTDNKTTIKKPQQ